MKLKTLLPIIFFALVFHSCDEDDADDNVVTPTLGVVNFVFVNEVDGEPILPVNLNYTNDAGNAYSVNLLKYYISNITFVKSDGAKFKAPNYELVINDSVNSKTFSTIVPVGNYTTLKFLMGVDSIKNHSGAQSGELDPIYGMFWDWNTGYLYFKHEGEFIDSTGAVLPLVYHYGGPNALVEHELAIALPVSSTLRTITITFNLNKIYRSPNVVDFNGNNLQSGVPGWVSIMKQNFPGSFTVTSIQ